MSARLTEFLHSLSVRLLVPLFLTVGAVVAVHAFLSFGSMQEHFMGVLKGGVERSGDLVKRATHDGMLLNRKEEVQLMLERLIKAPEVAAIRILDKEGTIVLSAHEEERGTRIALDSGPCTSCHVEGDTSPAASLQRRHLIRTTGGREVLRYQVVIENEPGCSAASCHAHPPDERVLGVLDMEMSIAPLQAAIGEAQRQLIWTTVALILIVGVVAAVFIRRLVDQPIIQLYRGTRRVANGNLDTPIEVRGRHELARLALAFNAMAEDLLAARSELTEWSQKLEDKVVEKTDELNRAQRQVLHMEKMASLGKLAATVAHELNNPISGILTYARLVERGLAEQPLETATKEELGRYLNLVEQECTRCGGIVKNLLLFARRSGAKMAPLDLNELVERSLMLVRHHLEISDVELHQELLSGDPEIVADAGRLQQALVALMVNAIEAMTGADGGEGELTVRLRGEAEEIWIDIADTGVGIPSEVLPRVFEPFFSTKDEESGVGLGLAVVYGIVQQHGGRIEVESEVGRGTVFHIRLPRQPRATPDDEPVVSDQSHHAD